MEKAIETGVANASEKALQKLNIPTAQIFPKETLKIGSKRKLEFPENFTLTPKRIGRKRKNNEILAVVPKVGSRKKGKRRKIGRGIILE